MFRTATGKQDTNYPREQTHRVLKLVRHHVLFYRHQHFHVELVYTDKWTHSWSTFPISSSYSWSSLSHLHHTYVTQCTEKPCKDSASKLRKVEHTLNRSKKCWEPLGLEGSQVTISKPIINKWCFTFSYCSVTAILNSYSK